MTLDDIRESTREAVDAVEQLAAHFERVRIRSAADFPLTGEAIAQWEDEPRERLHVMLRMFEQLYDLIGRRLFRGFLLLSGEDAAGLSARNLFRRMEALNGLSSADRWIEIGTTRNLLVHDYPTSAARQAERGNRAWADSDDLLAAAQMVIARLREEQLI